MIDHRWQMHSNWRFGKPTPRWCPGFRPSPHRGDMVVAVGLGLIAAALVINWIWSKLP